MAYYRQRNKITHSYYAMAFKDFWWSKESLVKALIQRIKEDKDNFILVTGQTGSGKSTLIGGLCFRLFSHIDNFITKSGKMFDKNSFVTDAKQFAYMMAKLNGKVIWYDEAREGVEKRSWFGEIRKKIVDRKNTNRKLLITTFLCMPFEREVDKAINPHITMWIWVRRGVGEIYCSLTSMKGGESLNIKRILDREEKWKKENPMATFVPPTIHDEYVGRIAFPPLTKEQRKIYNRWIKEKSSTGKVDEKEEAENQTQRNPDDEVKDIINLIKKKKLTTKEEVFLEIEKINMDVKMKDKLEFFNIYSKTFLNSTFDKLFTINKEKTKHRKITLD